MELTFVEQLKVIAKRKNIKMSDIAGKLGISRQNLHNKLSRGNLSEEDMQVIASTIDCKVVIALIPLDVDMLSKKGSDSK